MTKLPKIKTTYKRTPTGKFLTGSNSAYEALKPHFNGSMDYVESFKIILLSRKLEMIGIADISSGGTSACIVDAKVVFQAALVCNASSIILCHNHPSGDFKPSPDDKTLTRRLVEAGKIIELPVFDHIIISSQGYYSFADEGTL